LAGIKHATTKADNQTGFASEWNAAHTIEAGTIVNADVNAAAAIAKSKIAPSGAWALTEHPTAPYCRVRNSAAQTIPNGTWTVLTFDTETYDNDTIHSVDSNTSRLTAKTAGVYLIIGECGWAANSTNRRLIAIRINGSLNIARQDVHSSFAGAGSPVNHVSTFYALAVNDYVDLIVYQNTGGTLDTYAAESVLPNFSMIWLSPA
jgi:hypothetical protein